MNKHKHLQENMCHLPVITYLHTSLFTDQSGNCWFPTIQKTVGQETSFSYSSFAWETEKRHQRRVTTPHKALELSSSFLCVPHEFFSFTFPTSPLFLVCPISPVHRMRGRWACKSTHTVSWQNNLQCLNLNREILLKMAQSQTEEQLCNVSGSKGS